MIRASTIKTGAARASKLKMPFAAKNKSASTPTRTTNPMIPFNLILNPCPFIYLLLNWLLVIGYFYLPLIFANFHKLFSVGLKQKSYIPHLGGSAERSRGSCSYSYSKLHIIQLPILTTFMLQKFIMRTNFGYFS